MSDWHPILDRAASGSTDDKLKAMVKDSQVLSRRMLQILAACDALAEDDRVVVLLDTAVATMVSFVAAQQDSVADHLLSRARAAPPMSAATYFDKERLLERRGGPPTLGSGYPEFQNWADMLDHRFISQPSASSSATGRSVAAQRRARATSSRRGVGGGRHAGPRPVAAPPLPWPGRGQSLCRPTPDQDDYSLRLIPS